MTQISDAKKGILTDEMKHVAEIEGVSQDFILKNLAASLALFQIFSILSPSKESCKIGKFLKNCNNFVLILFI